MYKINLITNLADKHLNYSVKFKQWETNKLQNMSNNLHEITLNNKSNQFKLKYFTYINRFILNFLQFLFKTKIHFSIKKLWYQAYNLERLKNHNLTIIKIKKYTRKMKNYKFINNFYKVLWISMRIKDSNFFLKWFCYRIELLFFKLHKNIPYLINIILKNFYKKLFTQTQIKGVFFSLRGKISVTGDAKKRHVHVKYGKHSSSTKNLRISMSKSQIKTKTGVMGVTFGLFF